ncbi:MAG: alpha/beta hydrolase [Acidimicrobiales bacterium]
MASPQFDKFLGLLRKRPHTTEVDVAAMRAFQDSVGGKFPDGVTGTPVDAGGRPAEWIETADADTSRAVLYLHGGGYVAGSIDSHRNLTGHLAQAAGCRVLALDYRLAPEHPHPAQVDDAVAAFRWMVGQGLAADNVAIAGDSAGGGLTAATALALRDAGDDLPGAIVCISPWVDMEFTGESMTTRADADPMVSPGSIAPMAGMFLGEHGDPHDPLAAPLHADLAGLPPTLIHVGDAEVLLDDSTRLAAKAEAAGVDVTLEVWPEMVHVWHASAGYVPESDAAIGAIADFLRQRLGY